MRTPKTVLMALGLLAASCGAAAQEAYLMGAAGRASWNFECGPQGCQRGSTAWQLAAGYRFNRLVAVEALYLDMGRARSSDYALNGRLGGTALGAQVLLGWRIGDIDLAGKIGWAQVQADFRPAPGSLDVAERRHHNEVIGGLMGAYHLTPDLSIRLDVDIVTVALNSDFLFYSRGADVTTVLLGAMLRF